ncbi:hypothetical protein [Candidatus Uabimicrobium amorphum]|uniref:Lipoprotein SmpA/OmlA domain-containing protein n=1 Tax=Uabimicrobium amorphum TaxID=2596890 RepID=A0A5S9IPJ0_UABAM|nr:hypothetical protein [Candidatus Uabimicrobium amorphum]BBM85246.1 hypothetical protein UABAM_03609 [Candidatus Uabimicrobium amorphum]
MRILCFMMMIIFISGCTFGERRVGSSDKWQSAISQVKVKQTTEAELIQIFGPPALTDVKTIKDHVVYYYWMEKLKNRSLYLFVYNYWDIDIQYDRAMFVFKDGVLQSYGISRDVEK